MKQKFNREGKGNGAPVREGARDKKFAPISSSLPVDNCLKRKVGPLPPIV